jgi:uncharacterized membrane protein (UPF0127 family)
MRRALVALAVLLFAVAPAWAQGDRPPLRTLTVELGSESFALEVARHPLVQYRGLGGRREIAPNGGMIFAYQAPRPMSFVMRDCLVPIDVAFLDAQGRVISTHSMTVEPARRPDEAPSDYEARLPRYNSGLPAQYAIEVAGGRLRELGVRSGQTISLDERQIRSP